MTKHTIWRWKEGVVDELKEHIELRYGNAKESSYESWIPIARISKPKTHIFIVEWIVEKDSPSEQIIVADARRELDFFLVEHDIDIFPDHWEYAIYHCSTSGNMYGSFHWSYFRNGNQEERYSSEVIDLSTEESAKLFGGSRKPRKYIKRPGKYIKR